MRIKEKAKEVIMEKVSMSIKDIMIKKVAEMSIKEEKNSDDKTPRILTRELNCPRRGRAFNQL